MSPMMTVSFPGLAHRPGSYNITTNQLARLTREGVIERILPKTYRMVAVSPSPQQHLRAALLWAGDDAAAAGRSGGESYGLEGVRAERPEIALPHGARARTSFATVHHGAPAALMVRTVRGIRVTGVEATLLRLAHELDDEAFEVACEDAQRRRLTSVPALRAYLDRFAQRGRPGVAAMRRLLAELDPNHPARSKLEVLTRRLLVAHGFTGFVREHPLQWNGHTYRFFAFPDRRTILETIGRRWHDDPTDYEDDHEKWSVPGRHDYLIVFATWDKGTKRPMELLEELEATRRAALTSA